MTVKIVEILSVIVQTKNKYSKVLKILNCKHLQTKRVQSKGIEEKSRTLVKLNKGINLMYTKNPHQQNITKRERALVNLSHNRIL